MSNEYKIVLSRDALDDISSIKKYILNNFGYREYAEKFSKKIKEAIQKIKLFPKSYKKTEYSIEGLDVYFKPYDTYLIFFVINESTITIIRILKDRMYWQSIIEQM